MQRPFYMKKMQTHETTLSKLIIPKHCVGKI